MIMEIYSIYDSKVEAYSQPFFLRSDGEAIRAITEVVNDPSTKFFDHAADYNLFHIGTYNDEHAHLMQDGNRNLGCLIEFKKGVKNNGKA